MAQSDSYIVVPLPIACIQTLDSELTQKRVYKSGESKFILARQNALQSTFLLAGAGKNNLQQEFRSHISQV